MILIKNRKLVFHLFWTLQFAKKSVLEVQFKDTVDTKSHIRENRKYYYDSHLLKMLTSIMKDTYPIRGISIVLFPTEIRSWSHMSSFLSGWYSTIAVVWRPEASALSRLVKISLNFNGRKKNLHILTPNKKIIWAAVVRSVHYFKRYINIQAIFPP